MFQTDNFFEFLKTAIPIAIALLVSTQLGLLVGDLQVTTLSPLMGVAFGSGSSISELKYEYNSQTIFQYGKLINRVLSVTLTLFIAYLLTKLSLSIGVKKS